MASAFSEVISASLLQWPARGKRGHGSNAGEGVQCLRRIVPPGAAAVETESNSPLVEQQSSQEANALVPYLLVVRLRKILE